MERRRFMQCLAWAGTGLAWAARGGVLSATTLDAATAAGAYEGRGYQSFDYRGVHFVGLVNVLAYKAGVGGALGDEQLAWLSRDLDAQSASTPIVVFSHVPLWAVYPAWGWTTADGEQVIGRLRRFGSVTALSGHIHQVLQKVRSEEHTSELQSHSDLVCRLLLEK